MTIFIIQYDLFFNNKKAGNTNQTNSKIGIKNIRKGEKVNSKQGIVIKSKTNPSENPSKR